MRSTSRDVGWGRVAFARDVAGIGEPLFRAEPSRKPIGLRNSGANPSGSRTLYGTSRKRFLLRDPVVVPPAGLRSSFLLRDPVVVPLVRLEIRSLVGCADRAVGSASFEPVPPAQSTNRKSRSGIGGGGCRVGRSRAVVDEDFRPAASRHARNGLVAERPRQALPAVGGMDAQRLDLRHSESSVKPDDAAAHKRTVGRFDDKVEVEVIEGRPCHLLVRDQVVGTRGGGCLLGPVLRVPRQGRREPGGSMSLHAGLDLSCGGGANGIARGRGGGLGGSWAARNMPTTGSRSERTSKPALPKAETRPTSWSLRLTSRRSALVAARHHSTRRCASRPSLGSIWAAVAPDRSTPAQPIGRSARNNSMILSASPDLARTQPNPPGCHFDGQARRATSWMRATSGKPANARVLTDRTSQQ